MRKASDERTRNFQTFRVWGKKINEKKLTPKQLDLYRKIRNDTTAPAVVLSDDVADSYDSIPRGRTSRIIRPGIGPLSVHDLLMEYSNSVSFETFLKNKLRISWEQANMVKRLITHMSRDRDGWDEMYLYRFIQLNEFRYSGTARPGETFGSFCQRRKSEIDRSFDTLNFTCTTESMDGMINMYGLSNWMSDTSILMYRHRGKSAQTKILNTMTLEEYEWIVEHRNHLPTVNGSNSTRILREVLDGIRQSTGTSVSQLRRQMLDAFNRSVGHFGSGNISEKILVNDFLQLRDSTVDGSLILKQKKIVEFLSRNSENITPIEMMSVLLVLDVPVSAFRSADKERAATIISTAFEKIDEPVDFVTFLSRLVLDYNGCLGTYTEWMTALDENLVDYSQNPLLTMMIVSPDGPQRRMRSRQKDFIERYRRWAE